MRFSVVVNTYNRAHSLELTLEGLRWLDHDDFEVVVVNGPSVDGTDELLARYEGRVKVVRCPERNLSASRNLGIAAAAGTVVAFIDDDAYPHPGWLTALERAFESSDEVAGAGGPVLDHTGWTFQAWRSYASRFANPRWEQEQGPEPSWLLCLPGAPVFPYTTGTNSAFRRDRLIELGGFDEEFEYYLDETDVCCRLIDKGWVVRTLDEGFVYHKFLPSEIRGADRIISSRFSIVKNVCYFALKHGLPATSFSELCVRLSEVIERERDAVRVDVAHGRLPPGHLERFESDAAAASTLGFERYRSGEDRTRPASWFDERREPFLPFRVHRPEGGRLRVALLTQEYPPKAVNGIGRIVHALAIGLAAAGHEVHAVVNGEGHPRVDLEDGVWVHRLPITTQKNPPEGVPQHIWDQAATLGAEVGLIHGRRPLDIVHVQSWDSLAAALVHSPDSYLTVIGTHTPLAVLVDVDGRHPASDPTIQQMLRLENRLYEEADGVLASGPAIVAELERRGVRFDPDRLGLVSHGLPDLAAGAGHSRVAPKPTDEVGVQVLFVGRLEPRKGIDVLLAAVPRVVTDHPGVTFTIVGEDAQVPGEDRSQVERFTATAPPEVASRVRFTGRIDDEELHRLYAECDVLVCPSRFESFGLTLLEAMMFSKPVIAVNVGGMQYIVEDGASGRLVPPDDAPALAAAIEELAGDPQMRRRMGKRARELYEQRFSQERMVQGAVAFYRRLLAHERARAPASVS
jgi:glycogen(starch) synthase